MITLWCAAFWILVAFLAGLTAGFFVFTDDGDLL